MPYVTATALASVSDDLILTVGEVSGSFSTQSGSRLGWTAGAGMDIAPTSNWSARLEYLYVNIEDIGTGGTAKYTPIPDVLGVGSAIGETRDKTAPSSGSVSFLDLVAGYLSSRRRGWGN